VEILSAPSEAWKIIRKKNKSPEGAAIFIFLANILSPLRGLGFGGFLHRVFDPCLLYPHPFGI